MGRFLLVFAVVTVAGCSVFRQSLNSFPEDAGQDAATADTGIADASDRVDAQPDADLYEDASTDALVAIDANGGAGGDSGSSGASGSGGSGGVAPTCDCDTVSDCCDGCDFTHACDEARSEPQCQAAMCDDVAGCSFMNAREALPCNDGDADTRDDRCASGACVGDRRECSSGPCCDGWNFKPSSVMCAEAAPASTVENNIVIHHDGGRVFTCYSNECRGRIEEEPRNVFCSGHSSACDGAFDPDMNASWSRAPITCGAGFTCVVGASVARDTADADFSALCVPANDCD